MSHDKSAGPATGTDQENASERTPGKDLSKVLGYALLIFLCAMAAVCFSGKGERSAGQGQTAARGGVTPAPGMPEIILNFVRGGHRTIVVPAGTPEAPGLSAPQYIPVDKDTQRVARYFWWDDNLYLLTDREYGSFPPQANVPSWKKDREVTGGKEMNVRSVTFKNPHPEEAEVVLRWQFY